MANSTDETAAAEQVVTAAELMLKAAAEAAPAAPAAPLPSDEFIAKLRVIRSNVEYHASRGDTKELGYALRDLIDMCWRNNR